MDRPFERRRVVGHHQTICVHEQMLIEHKQFPAGFRPVVGQLLQLNQPDGTQYVGRVADVNARGAVLEVQSVTGSGMDPLAQFGSPSYQRHNARRQEHLSSLNLPLHDRSVLEVGAGIGDHTSFFLDRGCTVTATEAREQNLTVLRQRFPNLDVRQLDVDRPDAAEITESFDIVYCYGLLYHLSQPAEAIAFLSARCRDLLLLETCVSVGEEDELVSLEEDVQNPTQSYCGSGCRPTRRWVFNRLQEHFAHVYLPTTQPWHEQFPIDWSATPEPGTLVRAVFVASHDKINDPHLVPSIPMTQDRH